MSEPFRARSGRAIYVEDTGGAGRGATILALHGLGGGAWFFSGFSRRMASRHRVVSVDLPGTGRSVEGQRHALSLESWVADLGDLVADRCGAPVVLLGHSLGTILALRASSAWPQHLRAMVFVGGLPEPRPSIRERLTARAEAIARSGLAGAGPTASAANFSRNTLEHQPELTGLYERLFELQDPDVYVEWCRVLIAASAAASIAGVRVPSLSIVGAEDQYAPPELVTAFMERLPHSAGVQVMADCGHLPFLERPQAFADAVADFVGGLC